MRSAAPIMFVAAIVFWLVVGIESAEARMRVSYFDWQVVERSELIVLGAIKDGSVQLVPHQRLADEAVGWHHRATLLITRVLKGEVEQDEISIIIHYGLDPMIDGKPLREGTKVDRGMPRGVAAGSIQIYDTGNSAFQFAPIVVDARENNLWFLRRREMSPGQPPSNDLGISDPEDVQPAGLENYFRCYLAEDAESAVRKHLVTHPNVASRALLYLQHLAVERILQIPDPAQRVEQLLPYYLNSLDHRTAITISDGIVAAGDVAGPYLLAVYESNQHAGYRQDIIRLWGRIQWAGCVDLLVNLLEESDQFWARQELEDGWWNSDRDPKLHRRRQKLYGQTYAAIHALGQIGDPRARHAVEMTRERWLGIGFENPQIVEACEQALARFD